MNISESLHTTDKALPLWINVPSEFRQIDLDEPEEDRIIRIAKEVKIIPGYDPTWQAHAIFAQESLINRLTQTGAIYAASFVASSEKSPTRLVSALFTVVVNEPCGLADQSLPVIARGLQEHGSHSETLLVDYPAGQAIARGEQHLVKWNGHSQSTRQAQIIFRLPDQRRLAMLGICSSDLQDWDDFVAVLDDIARTVSFTKPNAASSSISNILDGRQQ